MNHGPGPGRGASDRPSLNRLAASATTHCLTGCAIGEVLGLAIATVLGWAVLPSIALAIALAFAFGYSLTLRPLIAGGLAFGEAARLAFAADTVSITVMEIVDNSIVLVVPGAMDADLGEPLLLGSPRALARDRRAGGLSGQPLAHRPGPRPCGRPRSAPLASGFAPGQNRAAP